MNFWEDGLWMMCFSHNKNSQHACSSQWRRSNRSLGYTFHGQRSCPGSTTAMLCFTVHQRALSSNCSEFRTMQLGLCSKCRGDPTLSRYYTSCIGCQSSSGSHTSWQFRHTKLGEHQLRFIYTAKSHNVLAA